MGTCASAPQTEEDLSPAHAHDLKSAASAPPRQLQSVGAQFDEADASRFAFREVTGSGGYSYRSVATEEVRGSIAEGIAKLKADPSTYVAIRYQTNVLGNEDRFNDPGCTLYLRDGTDKLAPKTSSAAAVTWILAEYNALPPDVPLGKFADKYTDKMSYKGRRLHSRSNPPLRPGRGMGVLDAPGVKIFGDVDPSDVHQGSVGDCWLLSAISALAEFDGAIHKLFEKTEGIDEMPRDGPNAYTVTLYDLSTWEPVDVTVDERLAAQSPGNLLGARPSEDNELWPCYLEKAIVAHCGGWDEVDGGWPTHGWSLLLGCKEVYTISRDGARDAYTCGGLLNPNTNEWEKQHSSIKKTCGHNWEMRWPDVGAEHGGADGAIGSDDLFRKMVAWDAANYIIASATRSGSDRDHNDGIYDGHAYTVVRAIEDVAGSGHDLALVRNPHGRGEMRSGVWDDDGPGWKKYPRVKNLLRPEKRDDGLVWMSKEEFFQHVPCVYLCAKDMTEFVPGGGARHAGAKPRVKPENFEEELDELFDSASGGKQPPDAEARHPGAKPRHPPAVHTAEMEKAAGRTGGVVAIVASALISLLVWLWWYVDPAGAGDFARMVQGFVASAIKNE